MTFKHKSEHTVEGKRYDLEFQIFHVMDGSYEKKAQARAMELDLENENDGDGLADELFDEGIVQGAIGIFFDTENYDKNLSDETIKSIEEFWDSIDYNNQKSDI